MYTSLQIAEQRCYFLETLAEDKSDDVLPHSLAKRNYLSLSSPAMFFCPSAHVVIASPQAICLLNDYIPVLVSDCNMTHKVSQVFDP